mgnify:CR=1 FL=1
MLLLTLIFAAYADDTQSITYDLVMSGSVVGHRELSIRYLDPHEDQEGEVRILESWTEIDARIRGLPVQIRNRATARATDSRGSFSSSMSINGSIEEIQGRQLPDGQWQLTRVRENQIAEQLIRRTEVDLSSLDLFDPVRGNLFVAPGPVGVVSVETGLLLRGPVEDLGEEELTIDGQTVLVNRWGFDSDEGRVELSRSIEGLILGWTMNIEGEELRATARSVPPERSFDTIAPLFGEQVLEEEL